jgi:hypothetical protein
MDIIPQILKLQDTANCKILVSATTSYSTVFNPGDEITNIIIIVIGFITNPTMTAISELLHKHNFIFQYANEGLYHFRLED